MDLTRFPRIRLAHLPTPLEPAPRLSEALGGPEIWIKRDDCTGLSTGGNKTRKLEFLMAEAQAMKADLVMTQGAIQSNHARQTAAAAARLGMQCHLLLEDRTKSNEAVFRNNGNVLLDHLHGATTETRPGGVDMQAELDASAEARRAKGATVYAIPGGGSNVTGALGYVAAAYEAMAQINDLGLRFDCLVHATGSAGTQAGLVAGLCAARTGLPVLGVGVRAPKEKQEANVLALAEKVAVAIGAEGAVRARDVEADCGYVGAGYGVPGADTMDAIRLTARTEGILLDPVYSGKGMAGLIGLIRAGRFKTGQRVLFWHTGGAAALFGYESAFGDERAMAV